MLNRYRYVFILSYGRTGSTLLAKLLSAHDGVLIRGENLNLAHHLMSAIAAAEDMRRFGKSGRPDSPDRPWFGNRAGDPSAFAAGVAENFVSHILKPEPDTRVIGFKEIRHGPEHMDDRTFRRYVHILLTVFPNARIIFNSRDVERVIVSGWWGKRDPTAARREVQAMDARFMAVAAQRPRAIHIRHEETISDAVKRADLFRFLGIEIDEERVEQVLATPLMHLKGRDDAESRADSGPPLVDRPRRRE